MGDRFEFDLEVAPKPVPPMPASPSANGEATSACTPRSEAPDSRFGKKRAKGWSETDAQKLAERAFRRDLQTATASKSVLPAALIRASVWIWRFPYQKDPPHYP